MRGLKFLLLWILFGNDGTFAKIDMNRNGCGDTKACLFKPAGCNPQLDCTIGILLNLFKKKHFLSKIFLNYFL